MNLKKNARAKVGAVLASLVALLVGWGLAHQNPPVPVAADTASTTDAAPAQKGTGPARASTSHQNGSGAARATAPVVKKRHVRTHVS